MNIHINPVRKLSSIQMEDASRIFSLLDTQRDYLGKWLSFVESRKEVADIAAYIHAIESAPEATKEPVFTIRYENEIIGLIGFVRTDFHNKKTEIGYWISQHHQGKGIMTKSVNALCHLAFEEWGMNRIQIKCAVGNTSSSNIPKRLSFTFEGVERSGEQFPDGSYKDLETYSLLKKEYKQLSPQP